MVNDKEIKNVFFWIFQIKNYDYRYPTPGVVDVFGTVSVMPAMSFGNWGVAVVDSEKFL